MTTTSETSPRRWDTGDPEPADVDQVRDPDGDIWQRFSGGWGIQGEACPRPWHRMVRLFGPVEEVTEEESR